MVNWKLLEEIGQDFAAAVNAPIPGAEDIAIQALSRYDYPQNCFECCGRGWVEDGFYPVSNWNPALLHAFVRSADCPRCGNTGEEKMP